MAGGARTAQTAGPATQPAADQVAIDELVHPVVRQLQTMASRSPEPPFGAIEELVRGHLADYDACLRAINRLWGNQAAAQVAIAVPHMSMATFASVTGGAGAGANPLAPATAAGGGGAAGPDVDVDRDPVTGEADVSASAGPVTGHVTTQPAPTAAHPNGPQLTGASVEVAGDVGANTHASVSGGAQLDPQGHATATGDASVTTRVTPNVAVGAAAHVESDGTSPVKVQGGASVRLRLNDVASLRAAGAVDSEGVLSQEIALEILQDPSPRVPISDDAHRRLRFFLRATEPTQIGGDPNAQTGASAQVGIGGTF